VEAHRPNPGPARVQAGRVCRDAPGYAKIAFNVRVERYGHRRTLITTPDGDLRCRQQASVRQVLDTDRPVQRADSAAHASAGQVGHQDAALSARLGPFVSRVGFGSALIAVGFGTRAGLSVLRDEELP
jgi:hypothetical protein